MATEATSRAWSNLAVPPGVSLLEELEARQLTPEVAASKLGVSQRQFVEILAGRKPLTAELALALESFVGIDAVYWMNLQTDYSLTLARNKRDGR